MLKGSIQDVKDLDRVLSEVCAPIKDSSGKGRKVYTKVYSIKGNPIYKRFRLFFDERDKTGTIKVTSLYGVVVGVSTFTLIHMGLLVKQSIIAIGAIL